MKYTQSKSPLRVRFAPSPTGYPHLGNIRTALFTWLFARHHGGTFILRIEDTDVARKVEGSKEAIFDNLKWLGLDWDEGPYFQSHRLDRYHELSEELIRNGHAYKCFCSPQRLEQMRQEQIKNKKPPKYDGHCRDLSKGEVERLESNGLKPVVRLKVPTSGETSFTDIIHGTISFKNEVLDDLVLLKSDGYPTYHLANVIDDHDMSITHVLRADEWISSTPRHILLYRAFGWENPEFAHLPMLLGPDKSKLSKRHGATTLNEYRDQGYLPETMINYLSLLGWSLDDKTEIFSKEELIYNFTLDRVSKTPAVFNKKKLEWMNGFYIRKLSIDRFSELAIPILEKELPADVARPIDRTYAYKVLQLLQERTKTLCEITQLAEFFFVSTINYDSALLLRDKVDNETAIRSLQITIPKLVATNKETWNAASLDGTLRSMPDKLNLSNRQYFGLLRSTTTGKTATPPLFETMEVLGKETCISRIKLAIAKLTAL